MEIDPVEVAILAIASMIGATAAAILWSTVTNLLRIKRKALVSFGFLLIGAVSGIAFLTPYLLPILAAPLVRILPDPIYLDMALEDPLLERLASEHPDRMKGLEARLIEAHLVNGVDGVRFESERFGLQVGSVVTAEYFARARAEDLIALMEVQGETFAGLAEDAPDLCYPFLFGIDEGEQKLASRMDEEISLDIDVQTERLIINAYDQVPGFDRELGEYIVRKAQMDIALEYGEDGIELMSGSRKPRSKSEQEMLCNAYSRYFATITAEGPARAEQAWRSLFAPVAAS